MSWNVLPGFILFGTLWVSWTSVAISFPILGKFSTTISSSIFSRTFFLSSSSGTPMIQMLGHLTLSQRSLRLSSFLLILFSSLFHLFPPFYLPPHLASLLPQLFYCWFPPSAFYVRYCIIHWPFFISSRSLLNISYIFSILVSNLFICDSILFLKFWIICTIIILNSFSGRLPISSSFVWFGGHLSYFFTCWIFLCFFTLFRLLCLGCPFCRLEVRGSFFLWSLLPVGGAGLVAWQGEMQAQGELASVFWDLTVWCWISQFGEGCQSLGPRLQHPLAFWLWLLHACLSASGCGERHVRSQLGPLWYSLNPLFCEHTRLWVSTCRGKVIFFPFWQSHGLGCYLTLAPSYCPQGIQAQSLS